MSREFIEARHQYNKIIEARKQQRDIRSLVVSDIQKYNFDFDSISDNIFQGDEPLKQWVSSIFPKNHFETFNKYLRYPLISSEFASENIEPALERVFFSEDGYEQYVIGGEKTDEPFYIKGMKFDKEVFKSLLYHFNDVYLIEVKDDIPYRRRISIDHIISIETPNEHDISRIAWLSHYVTPEGEEIEGYMYADSEVWAFYDKEFEREPIIVPHEMKDTPVDWVSNEAFGKNENYVLRKGVFSKSRVNLEKLVFLHTLLSIVDPNGTIPVAVKPKSSATSNEDEDTVEDGEFTPFAPDRSKKREENNAEDELKTGGIVEVPVDALMDDSGKISTDLLQNYFVFHRQPVDSLKYANDRIKSIKAELIVSVVGFFADNTEAAKNELQIFQSVDEKQNKIRKIGYSISSLRNSSDLKMINLYEGFSEENKVLVSKGTDFFLESDEELNKLFNDAQNPMIRSSVFERMIKKSTRFNPYKKSRDMILKDLLPFSSDKDFNTAIGRGWVSIQDEILQLRFDYYIGLFEAEYGDIVTFYKNFEEDQSPEIRLTSIRSLINELINGNIPNKREQA